MNIIHYDICKSTNLIAAELAAGGASDETVVCAKGQSAGMGTNGRSFFSPYTTGIYASLILRSVSLEALSHITAAAAVSISRTVDRLFGVETKIKPINDVYLGKKKICGILTRSKTVDSVVDYVIIGFGINLFKPVGGFPPELEGTAGFILSRPADEHTRLGTLKAVCDDMCAVCEALSDKEKREEILSCYAERTIKTEG